MEKASFSKIGTAISRAHALAYDAYCNLQDIDSDIDISDDDAQTLSELLELSDELQSSLYEFLSLCED